MRRETDWLICRIDWLLRWEVVAVLFFLPTIPFYLVPHDLRWVVSLSVINGEIAIASWTQHGFSITKAVIFGAACGTYDLFFYLVASLWLRKVYNRKLRQSHQLVNGWIGASPVSWHRKILVIGASVYYFFVPRNPKRLSDALSSGRKWNPYLYLVGYGFVVGGFFAGIGYMLEMGLNVFVGFLIEAAANALKIAVVGIALTYGVNLAQPYLFWIPAPWRTLLSAVVMLAILALMKRYIERRFAGSDVATDAAATTVTE